MPSKKAPPKQAKKTAKPSAKKKTPGRRAVEPAQPKKPLTPKQEAFTENYLANGFNGTQAAKAAGYQGDDHTLSEVARENLRKPVIASRVRERLDGLKASADEVLHLLADHLRADAADLADCFVEDGSIDWALAKQKGVSRLIKKFKRKTRFIPQGDGEPPIKEVEVEFELHDAQGAAGKLIPVHGLKQKPSDNEHDAERRKQQAEERIQKLINECGFDRAGAIAFVQENAPNTAKWIN